MGFDAPSLVPPIPVGNIWMNWAKAINAALVDWSTKITTFLNSAIQSDGEQPMTAPLRLAVYASTVALPPAASWPGGIAVVGTALYVSNGTTWTAQ
jgi:hypothetical protein